VAKKYWRRQNIGGDKILAVTEIICVDKIIAVTKISRRQNIGADKILVSTKIRRQQKSRTDRTLASTKILRQQNVGAESTAADFSQTLLKISYVSLMVLIPLNAVAKCGVASGRPAFMGGLSPALYQLVVPACHIENVTDFGADKISASA
jgi:hypothetical protein